MKWILYDIHRNLYWNEQHQSWVPEERATSYSTEQRDQTPLKSLRHQWRLSIYSRIQRQPAVA